MFVVGVGVADPLDPLAPGDCMVGGVVGVGLVGLPESDGEWDCGWDPEGEGEPDEGEAGDPEPDEGEPDEGEPDPPPDPDAEVGTGGGGGLGGTFWKSSTAMSRPKAAIMTISSHAIPTLDQPARSPRPGQGSGQVREVPASCRSAQYNR